MAEQYLIVYRYHSFFIHSYIDRHLGSFHVLAIINSAAMNIGMHVYFWIGILKFLIIKFLTIFLARTLRIHFSVDPTSYIVSPGSDMEIKASNLRWKNGL